MGACCNSDRTDAEIESADTVDEILNILSDRIMQMEKEQQQIQDYLLDNSVEVEAISVEGIDPNVLKLRIPFLRDLQNAYDQMIQIISGNKSINIQRIKEAVSDVTCNYEYIFDPNGMLKNSLKRFIKIINEETKT